MLWKNIDRVHIALAIALAIVLIALAFQAKAVRDAQNDVARYKQVGVWALVHSQIDFIRYAQERDTYEETLRKYLTPEGMQALLAVPHLPGNAPALPADPPVDKAALQDVLAIWASGQWRTVK